MITYVDTSAAVKLLIEEPESAALAAHIQSHVGADDDLVAGWLLHTELSCAVRRRPEVIDEEAVRRLLDSVTLVDVTRGDFLTAAALPWALPSHDAIHLAVALRVGADAFVGYDNQLQRAASAAGLDAVRPA